MVGPFLSGTPSLVPVTAPNGVTPGGLLLVDIISLGEIITGMVFGYLVPMGPTVSFLEKRPSGFELDLWELLFSRSAQS